MPPSDPVLVAIREDLAKARAETKGVQAELRLGLERLAATWAEDAKQRHDLTGAIKEIAKTTKTHADDLAALKKRQEEDDHEKTRAKTAITIFRVAGGTLLSLMIATGGYLLRSYIEVRDASRDHTAAIAAMRETEARMAREHADVASTVREHDGAVIQVRTRLDDIDRSLERIEAAVSDRRRR